MKNATRLMFQSFVKLPEFVEPLKSETDVQDLGKSSRNSSLMKDLESFVRLNKRAWDRGHPRGEERSRGGRVGCPWRMGRATRGSEGLATRRAVRWEVWPGRGLPAGFRELVLNPVMNERPLQILEQRSYVVREDFTGERRWKRMVSWEMTTGGPKGSRDPERRGGAISPGRGARKKGQCVAALSNAGSRSPSDGDLGLCRGLSELEATPKTPAELA